jgi:hypothetical protein
MKRRICLLTMVVGMGACGGVEVASPGGDRDQGRTEAGTLALTLGGAAGRVASVDIKVVAGDQDCSAAALADASVDVAAGHAETTFVLAPRDYLVCVSAFDASGAPVDSCHGEGHATVMAGVTARVDLSLNCSDPQGGLGVDVNINQAPVFTGLTVTPSRSITTCGTAIMGVEVSDPEGEVPVVSWFVAAPGGGTLIPSGRAASFHADVAGTYVIGVTATDSAGASATLTFPIEVTAAAGGGGCPLTQPTCENTGTCRQPFCSVGHGRYAATDDVVIDNAFGQRLWQRGFGPGMNFADALAFCASLRLGGLDGWRVPSNAELLSIVLKPGGLGGGNDACFPSIDQAAFFSPSGGGSFFWTTTEGPLPLRFMVDFSDGRAKHAFEDQTDILVRCLHDAP